MLSNHDDDDGFIAGQFLPPPDQNAVIFEGWLEKKSPKSIALFKWQERFVRLTKEGLFYYKKKDQPPQGAVPLHCIERIECNPITGKQKTFRIDIYLQEQYQRVFSFIAKTESQIQQWKSVLSTTFAEAKRNLTSQQRINAIAIAEQGGGKIWKMQPNKPATVEDVGTGVTRRHRNTDRMLRQLFDGYMQFSKPLYPHMVQPSRVSIFENLQVLSQTLFGDFRIESEEQNTELGAIFILGNQHYHMTHKSFLMHTIYRDEPLFNHALGSMDLLSQISQFPIFPRQIHFGQTREAIYSIYHPPLRTTHDSLFAWLAKVDSFPEHIIAWIAAHVILALQFLYQLSPPVQLTTLSPETIFFDGTGGVRICDLFLNTNPTLLNAIPEYTSPEVLEDQIKQGQLLQEQQQMGTFAPASGTAMIPPLSSDFWRLGVLLYELATGLPPFRPQDDHNLDGIVTPVSLLSYKQDILTQIQSYAKDPSTLTFPSTVSNELKDLIKSLLLPSPEQRLQDPNMVKSHAFFTAQLVHLQPPPESIPFTGQLQLWDIDSLLQVPRPQWITNNIIKPLIEDELTPSNLSFFPEPVFAQRLTVNVLHLRHLPSEVSQRIVCNISVENETQKTPMGSQLTSELIEVEVGDPITFDIVNNGLELSSTAEVMIEVTTLTNQQDLKAPNKGTNTTVTASKATFVGLVTYPLARIRQVGTFQGWLTILDVFGCPIGEMEVMMSWEVEHIDLNPQLLTLLTNEQVSFATHFGKPMPQHPRKLHSLILDPSALAVSEESTQQQQAVDQKNHNNTMTLNLSTINISQMQAQSSGPGSGGGPQSMPTPNKAGMQTLKLVQNSSHQQQQQQQQQQPSSLNQSNSMLFQSGTSSNQAFGQHIYQPPSTAGLPSLPLSPGVLHQSSNTGFSPSTGSPHIGALSSSYQTPAYMNSPGGRQSRAGLLVAANFNATAISSPGLYASQPTISEAPPPLPPLPPSSSFALDDTKPSSASSASSLGEATLSHAPTPSFDSTASSLQAESTSFSSSPQKTNPTINQLQSSPQPQTSSLPATKDSHVPAPELPPPPPADVTPDPDSIAANWRTAKSADGVYYFNRVTRNTSWEPPACLVEQQGK